MFKRHKKLPEFKPMRQANCYAFGGMISSGKSSLIKALSKELENTIAIYELAEENGDTERSKIDTMLLKGLYDKTIDPSVFQMSFLLNRDEKYKKNLEQQEKTILFDRTIFEDRLFAHQNMMNKPIQFAYYDKMWSNLINELLYLVGTPKHYFILDVNGSNFQERLFKRNRGLEVDNFKLNKSYFKSLLKAYIPFLKGVCEMYGIPYSIIDTNNKTPKEVKEEVINIIKTLD